MHINYTRPDRRLKSAMNRPICLLMSVPAVLCAAQPAHADASSPVPAIVTPYADIRYRLETVDQDGLPHDATASTLRVRAGLKTGAWHGLSAVVEGEAIVRVGPGHYNDSVNGKTAYPLVADPADVLLNQAYIVWRPIGAVEVVAGRQAVNIDNQRWIGSVNWRQNDQTLDAGRITLKPLPGLTVDYLHAWRVNRVFGPDSPQGIWRDSAINGARVAATVKPVGTISAYGYWLDIPAAPAGSSRTLGMRLAGERPVGGGVKLLYAAEYAGQRDFGANPLRFSLDYRLAEAGVAVKALTAKIGYERLEGDGQAALQTPLATLHAFNGWADKFLTTPANGLRDIYVDAGWKVGAGPLKGLALRGMWHDYRSTRGGIGYGREWDVMASLPVVKAVTLSAKLARYDARAFATDTTKAWLSIDVKL